MLGWRKLGLRPADRQDRRADSKLSCYVTVEGSNSLPFSSGSELGLSDTLTNMCWLVEQGSLIEKELAAEHPQALRNPRLRIIITDRFLNVKRQTVEDQGR